MTVQVIVPVLELPDLAPELPFLVSRLGQLPLCVVFWGRDLAVEVTV